MKIVKDKFSKQAHIYKKHRPVYPKKLYEYIFHLVPNKQSCWDCGTGNGQVAAELSVQFETVCASDISERQLEQAVANKNIVYSKQRAEKTNFKDNQFNLITVAQAVHWFDFDSFNKEVNRVGKKGAIICIWGYGLLSIDARIDQIIDEFYTKKIGPYWNEERKHIDNEYQSVTFDFKEIKSPNDLFINLEWNIDQLEGYFNSWSSVQNYLEEHPDSTPVVDLILKIKRHWGNDEFKKITFPIFMRTGMIQK